MNYTHSHQPACVQNPPALDFRSMGIRRVGNNPQAFPANLSRRLLRSHVCRGGWGKKKTNNQSGKHENLLRVVAFPEERGNNFISGIEGEPASHLSRARATLLYREPYPVTFLVRETAAPCIVKFRPPGLFSLSGRIRAGVETDGERKARGTCRRGERNRREIVRFRLLLPPRVLRARSRKGGPLS